MSKKMQKTATIAVERIVVHPIYKKRYKRVKKYQVQDDFGVEVGRMVKFIVSRPYSKTKKWKIIEVIGQNEKTDKTTKTFNYKGSVTAKKGKLVKS